MRRTIYNSSPQIFLRRLTRFSFFFSKIRVVAFGNGVTNKCESTSAEGRGTLSFRIPRRDDNGGSTGGFRTYSNKDYHDRETSESTLERLYIFNITPPSEREKKKRISLSFCANEFSQFSRVFDLVGVDLAYSSFSSAPAILHPPELLVEIEAKYLRGVCHAH